MQYGKDEAEKKLDWMYKKPGQTVNHEEYLLGRSIDKEFEALAQEERLKNQIDQGLAPKNHVEHECVPFSIRSYKDAPQEQVDMARKLQEDPLVAIKKREMESRQQLLQNPVKLKELHRILKEEKLKNSKKKKKKKKDEAEGKTKTKKSKHKHKSVELGEKNLDDILAEKYAKLKATLDETLDMGSLLRDKKKKKKKHSSSEESSDTETNYKEKHDSKSYSKNRNDKKSFSGSQRYGEQQDIKGNRDYDHGSKLKRHGDDFDSKYHNKSSRYCDREQNTTRSYRSQGSSRMNSRDSKYHHCDTLSKGKKEESNRTEHYEDSSDNHRKRESRKEPIQIVKSGRKSSPSDEDEPSRQRYGLVSADGKKIALKGTIMNKEKKSESKLPAVKKHHSRHRRPKLTEEEIEERRKQMYENALWRDKQLENNIKKYKEDELKEHQKNNSADYDTDFLKKQLAKAAEVGSLESRIKSNINNIQRNSRAMDTNFAKR